MVHRVFLTSEVLRTSEVRKIFAIIINDNSFCFLFFIINIIFKFYFIQFNFVRLRVVFEIDILVVIMFSTICKNYENKLCVCFFYPAHHIHINHRFLFNLFLLSYIGVYKPSLSLFYGLRKFNVWKVIWLSKDVLSKEQGVISCFVFFCPKLL